MQSESRDRVSSLPPQPAAAAAPAGASSAALGGASGRFPSTAPVPIASGLPQHAQFRPRAPSLIPNMDAAAVEIVKAGWLNKQGGAKGGRKSWKRRWFVLKEDSLYYKESPESTVLLGVMPVHGCHILDLGCLTQSAPPVHNETQTMCHECKKPFTFLDRKHHCRHCGNTFCNADSSKRIAIPKYGFHSRVRVCDGCYESVAAELESSEVVIKLLELTGEKPEGAEILKASGPAIAAHAQAMEQLKSRGSLTPSAHNKRSSFFKGGGWGGGLLPIDEKKRFTLPTVNKPHLFALKNSERELWLHAENTETRLEWVQAIRSIQKRKSLMGGARGGAANAEAAAALPGGPGAAASSSEALVPALPPKPAGPSWEIDFHAITVLNKVGVGAFGEVFRARLWGTEVAMKTLKTEQFKDEAALVEDLKKEVSILSQLRHPNVVLYIGACTIPPNVCIMTEWCSRGSLYDVLHDYSIHLNAKLVIDLAMGIAQGMNYLHSLENKIIHRDLKSHNILVNKTFQVKVADFGLSHVRELQAKESADGNAAGAVVHKGPRHYGIFGTPEWMAPEVMEGNVYTEKIDVYSFGILLSELVTRSMPFHDLFKITSYMDVVDAVLDQGAIPTIPNWCENLLGGLIQACVSRIPAERPNFTDLILRLREVAELDDSIYFFQFDLPRLRELMRSSNPAIQSLAASEVAVLLTQPHIRRRSSPGELADGESPDPLATPMPAASPAGHSSLSSSPGGGPLSIVGSPTSPLRLPSPAPGTGTQSHLLSPPSASASSSPPVRRSSNDNNSVSGLGSPLATGSGFAATPSNGSGTGGQQRSPHIDGDTWILDNDDAFDFLERFTALLSSSHREVQLNSCNALISLLRLSHGDKSKRAQDRELIIQNGGLASLLTLLLSEQLSLSTSAGSVLLLLTEDLTSEEQKTFTGLNTQGLTHLQSLILSDIDRDSRALQEIQRKIIHKKRVLEVIQSCAARGAADASAAGGSPALKRPTSSVRGKRSVMLPKFVTNPNSGSGGSSQHLGLGLQAAAPEEDSDDDSDRTISRHLVAHTAAAQAAATADEWDNPGGGRGRAETAQPQTLSPPHNDSPALQALFAKLQELLVKSAALPEKFSDWYSNSIAHGYALRYELEGDSWSLCFIVLLPDELRLFHDARDEPDEPLLILRTKVAPPPEFDDPSPIPAKVRVGPKHGLSHCFQIEDCGRIFTFCAGDQTQQERWRFLITGQPKPGTTATTAAVPAGAAAGQSLAPNRPVPRPSMAPSQVHGGSTMGQFAANPLPVAYSSSVLGGVDVSAGAAPTTAASSAADSGANPALVAMSPRQVAEPDPTIGRDMPQLELPTPPFAKRYRNITYHGYLMLRDRSTNTWLLKYLLLVDQTLRVFDSHRSSPNEPWAEHEIDADNTNVSVLSSSSLLSKAALGANQFFIRLHSSSVQFDVWAANADEKAKWIQALGGDRLAAMNASSQTGVAAAAASAHAYMGSSPNVLGTQSLSASAVRIAAFASYYGHIDYYGYLYRKRKLTNRWLRSWVILVDSEIHYYASPHDACDAPRGTFYIATNSGRAFDVKQSPKRPHCLSIINPSRTFYLAAETEKEYLGWTNAIHQNIKRLGRRQQIAPRRASTVV